MAIKKIVPKQPFSTIFFSSKLMEPQKLGTNDFPGAQATGANIQTSDFTFHQSADTLNVRFPSPFGFKVGMADIKSATFTFSADFTQIGHQLHLLQS
jgi:hypothetical protein